MHAAVTGIHNILVIEDDPAIRQIIRDILEIQGYQVSVAASGHEGIQQLKTIRPQPCVVLLDLMMPVTNGWQFLDFQRNDPSLAKVPVIICSAYKESAMAVHPSGFVQKPVQLNELLDAVRTFCH
jgi:CheY-like chemotaxis protein